MTDHFNMSDFLDTINGMSDDERRKFVSEGISDAMDDTTAAIAPRIWALLQAEMSKSPEDIMRMNAILNSAFYAISVWTAVCVPEGEKDEEIVQAAADNLRQAFKHARPHLKTVSQVAAGPGRMMLTEDTLKGLAGLMAANTALLARIAQGGTKE